MDARSARRGEHLPNYIPPATDAPERLYWLSEFRFVSLDFTDYQNLSSSRCIPDFMNIRSDVVRAVLSGKCFSSGS